MKGVIDVGEVDSVLLVLQARERAPLATPEIKEKSNWREELRSGSPRKALQRYATCSLDARAVHEEQLEYF